MKGKRSALVVGMVGFITGCAASSGVLKMGLDTYTISASASPARGGVAGAKATA